MYHHQLSHSPPITPSYHSLLSFPPIIPSYHSLLSLPHIILSYHSLLSSHPIIPSPPFPLHAFSPFSPPFSPPSPPFSSPCSSPHWLTSRHQMARRGYFDDMGLQPQERGASEDHNDNHNHNDHDHTSHISGGGSSNSRSHSDDRHDRLDDDGEDQLVRHRYLALVYDVMVACSGGKSSLLSGTSFGSGGGGSGGGGSSGGGGGGALMWKGMSRMFTALRPHLMHALTAHGTRTPSQSTRTSTSHLDSTSTITRVPTNVVVPSTSPTAPPVTVDSPTLSVTVPAVVVVSEGLARVVRMIELGNTHYLSILTMPLSSIATLHSSCLVLSYPNLPCPTLALSFLVLPTSFKEPYLP